MESLTRVQSRHIILTISWVMEGLTRVQSKHIPFFTSGVKKGLTLVQSRHILLTISWVMDGLTRTRMLTSAVKEDPACSQSKHILQIASLETYCLLFHISSLARFSPVTVAAAAVADDEALPGMKKQQHNKRKTLV